MSGTPHWTPAAEAALAKLQLLRELTAVDVERVRQLAEQDATTDVVYPINVGYGAARAGCEAFANLGLGAEYDPMP